MTAKIEEWVKKLAQHVMMVLAYNTPNGPTEYEQALKVISSIIADDIAAHAPKEKHQQPSVAALEADIDEIVKLAHTWRAEAVHDGHILSAVKYDCARALLAILNREQEKQP